MANRDMTNQMYSFEKARKFVNARCSFGGTGAVTIDGPNSKGVLAISRNSTGNYTFQFGVSVNGLSQIDGYAKLLSVNWTKGINALGTTVNPGFVTAEVYRNDILSGFSLAPPVQAAAGTATSGGTLTDSTTYYYVVTAIDPNGVESLISNEISKATGNSGGNTNTITVNWTAVPGASSYRVYRGTSSAAQTVVYTVAGGSTATYLDTNAATNANASTGVQARPPLAQGSLTLQCIDGSMAAADPASLTIAHVEFQFGDSGAA